MGNYFGCVSVATNNHPHPPEISSVRQAEDKLKCFIAAVFVLREITLLNCKLELHYSRQNRNNRKSTVETISKIYLN